jgi:hypothetical protein
LTKEEKREKLKSLKKINKQTREQSVIDNEIECINSRVIYKFAFDTKKESSNKFFCDNIADHEERLRKKKA